MAKFNVNEADNYGGNGGGGFFSLRNDKDVATVRFMYNVFEDVEGYAVHEVEVDGKKRYVNCLRGYNEPVDNCPLCAARYKVLAKIFVKLYDEETGEVKIWDRGKTFLSKLSSLCARYKPLVSTPFEIERNGKKGDTSTTYETYALTTDETKLEDLPEAQELLGTLILDKSLEELQYFLDNGQFPETEQQAEKTQERVPQASNRPQTNNGIQRRTAVASTTNIRQPINRRPGNTDKF